MHIFLLSIAPYFISTADNFENGSLFFFFNLVYQIKTLMKMAMVCVSFISSCKLRKKGQVLVFESYNILFSFFRDLLVTRLKDVNAERLKVNLCIFFYINSIMIKDVKHMFCLIKLCWVKNLGIPKPSSNNYFL